MNDQVFANQVAVVTGAGGGIGRSVAVRLAAHGATVCLLSRNRDALSGVQRTVQERGGRALVLPADLTVDASLAEAADIVRREHGRVDLLVHCAGAYGRGRIDATPVDVLDAQYRTNVRGPYLLTQLLLPLIASVEGQIVFLNSTAGVAASGGTSAYAASKHALKAIADALRDEVNPIGVRVISVFPGRTNTPMQRQVHALEGKEYEGDRLMQPEDVAEVVTMTLALPKSAEVTNVTVRPMRKT